MCHSATNHVCKTLHDISLAVSQDIDLAKELGFYLQEETITETSLLSLKKAAPFVKIVPFPRHREGKNGADWEWWIGSEKSWLGMRVQAKKKRPDGDRFIGLQKYQTKSQPIPQIDVLLQQAKKDRLIPTYCFYVGQVAVFSSSTHNTNVSANALHGCFVAHAWKIKNLSSNRWKDLHPLSLPWHQMCCDCSAQNPSHSGASSAVQRIYDSLVKTVDNKEYCFEPRELPSYLSDPAADLKQVAKERKLSGFIVIDVQKTE